MIFNFIVVRFGDSNYLNNWEYINILISKTNNTGRILFSIKIEDVVYGYNFWN